MKLDVELNVWGKVIRAYTNCMSIIRLTATTGGKGKRSAVKKDMAAVMDFTELQESIPGRGCR
jgi:hypothetical protein